MKELIDALVEGKWKRAQNETWGHLKSSPGRHKGYMIFGCGEYGDIFSVVSEFDGVPGSPWFFQAHMDFIRDNIGERGTLQTFVGFYCRGKGDDCGHFEGKIAQLSVRATGLRYGWQTR